jgi:hypothetical protein
VPAGQFWQLVVGSLSWSTLPTPQRKVLQAPLEPAGTKVPAGQGVVQGVELLLSISGLPAGQAKRPQEPT